MQAAPFPLTRDIVLIGGGHTHALVLLRWGMRPMAGARLTLIHPGPTAPYSGMLPGHIAGHYSRDDLDIDLVRLARHAGARLVLGAADGIDLAARTVSVPGRPPVAYDLCAIDIGVTATMPDLPGFAAHGVPAKPLGPFADGWAAHLDRPGAGDAAIIGAGVAGAEIAMAMAHALAARAKPGRVTVIERGTALAALPPRTARRLGRAMAEAGIEVVEHAAVAGVDATGVTLDDGRRIAATFVAGAAGARPYSWLAATGLDLHDGFVAVDACLRSSDPAVFAVGDCAHLTASPRPKAGVYAVRQAPVLFDNLRALASGGRPRPYRAQRDYLKLISLGARSALADRGGWPVAGPAMWRWKDRIDRRFMDRFRTLPQMPAPALPRDRTEDLAQAIGPKPLCGGCGAKVGRGALQAALAGLPRADRPDITQLPGDDAGLVTMGDTRQVLSVDHLRAVTQDPVLMTRIAAVHALGDIWAMGAAPQAALASLILPRMTPELQRRTLAEIMAAAAGVLAQAGAEIVGGHSTQGDELTIGFTLTGLVAGDPITLAGGRPGDALILTKPLGTGVILAAEMAGRARGAWVTAAYARMVQPQAEAARLLAGAHAMTDVTGFGLAGHLQGICAASGTGAVLTLDAIPLLDGAADLAAAGIRSTLFDDNRALAPALPEGGAADLLFDPQTCGGLLAALPAADADAALAALTEAGYVAARIGTLTDGAPQVTLSG